MLEDSAKRKTYDGMREGFKVLGLLVQSDIGEVYTTGAYEPDGNDSDDSEYYEQKPMSKGQEEIIESMGPWVKKYLESGDSAALTQLQKLDKKMIKLNQSEKSHPGDYNLPFRFFKETHESWKKHVDKATKAPLSEQDRSEIEKARQELKALQVRLRNKMEEQLLPLTWTFDTPPESHAQPEPRTEQSSPDTQSANQPAGSNGTANASERAPSVAPDAMDTSADWKAGQTLSGREIVAYRRDFHCLPGPNGNMVVEEMPIDFVVMTNDPNPIQIMDSAQVGQPAVNAYLALPEEQKNSITNIAGAYNRSHRSCIYKVKGYACKYAETGTGQVALGVALIDFRGEDRVVNLTALRNALGRSGADRMIRVFLENLQQKHGTSSLCADFKLKQKKLKAQQRLLRKGYQIGSGNAHKLLDYRGESDTESESESDSDSGYNSDVFFHRRHRGHIGYRGVGSNSVRRSELGRYWAINPQLERRKPRTHNEQLSPHQLGEAPERRSERLESRNQPAATHSEVQTMVQDAVIKAMQGLTVYRH
jgi:hypothetical protein